MLKMLAVVLGLVSLGHLINADHVATGTYYQTTAGTCDISLRACGLIDKSTDETVYIKVNGVTYLSTNYSINSDTGFNFFTLHPSTCKASDYKHFDTFLDPDASNNLANYINGLADGTTIVCVSSFDVENKLQDTAKNALKSIGVDVSTIEYCGKVLFHAVKGKPEKTVMKLGKSSTDCIQLDENALAVTAAVDVDVDVDTATCNVCKNGGSLRVNAARDGFKCQCTKKFIGLHCGKINPAFTA